MPLETGGKLILAFVTLLIGAVLIGSIAVNSNAVTDLNRATNESQAFYCISSAEINTSASNGTFFVTNAPTSWKVADCPLTDFTLNQRNGTLLIEDTDYTLNKATGNFSFINSDTAKQACDTVPANTSHASYSYCGDDYMNLSWGRTGMDVAIGLFAVAILLASVGLFYSVGKDYGMFG